ncbi:MAG: hypothetical protein EBT26_09535 [Microbacteriaceae bacterium]|nr:hypothetical protein [Microbacteriaceae bacterium]
MDPKELRDLCEAYTAVYDEELRYELEEMSDEFAGIEDLSDEEIDAIVEETIDEMLDEGYEFGEVEQIFESVILEMNPYAPAGSKAAKEYAQSTTATKRRAERSAARAATVSKVKNAVKSALGGAKDAVKSGVKKAQEFGRNVKYRAVDKPVAAYATKRNLHPAAGMAARSKDSEKRRGLRARVAADIKSRIKNKIADVAGRARQGVQNTITKTKGGVKNVIGTAASKVASGASRLAARMAAEEIDVYDVVLSHLLDEGYAETYESAEKIMVNMSESWVDEILEGLTPEQIKKIAQQAATEVTGKKPTTKSGRKLPAGMRE